MQGVSFTRGWSWPDFPPQVCEEDNYHVSWAVKMVHRIYNLLRTAAEKIRFIQQLESMFSTVTMEMLEFSVTGGATLDWESRLTFHDAFCLFSPWMIIDIRLLSTSRKCVMKFKSRNPSCASRKQCWRQRNPPVPAFLPELDCSLPR